MEEYEEKVSIIMPSYNTGEYISEAIDSVKNQTYTNWELLIVDDGSSDDTDKIVAPYLMDKRIRYHKNPRNLGAAEARNLALRKAEGRWIAFLDSDDIWRPDKLTRQIKFMKENNYSFSYTNYTEIDETKPVSKKIVSGPKRITKSGFYNYCWPGCLTVMYDAARVGLVQTENLKRNNDYAIWLKVCRKADCYLLEENLAIYRRGRPESISNRNPLDLIMWHFRLFYEGEHESFAPAIIHTLRNLFFGVWKKLKYVGELR